MIVGIGIDSVEIARFKNWQHYPHARLRKIFSEDEIAYCLCNQAKSAERFALRFAAREAFFKALHAFFAQHRIPFLTVCRHIQVAQAANGHRYLIIDWPNLLKKMASRPNQSISCLSSFTHTDTTATAFIVLQDLKES